VTDINRTLEAVFRIEWARLVAGLSRRVRDVGLAEELAQDALLAAYEQWPQTGVPQKPGAWLMAAAKNRAVDRLRRGEMLDRKHQEVARELEEKQRAVPDLAEAIDDQVGDDLLRLMLISCHPVLQPEARVALTLRLLGGLETGEIARAFLVPEATVAQRIVRAKKKLADAKVPFEAPRGAELEQRLDSVLEVLYLIFNEGYAATAGDDWLRPSLCEEALRLGRILVGLVPAEPEAHALVALMEIQASRNRARTGPGGEPILLLEQNRARWDQLLIRRGLKALEQAEKLGGALGRLEADRRSLRPARPANAVADRRAQPRGRRLDGRRSAGRPRPGRRAPAGACAARLSPLAQRAGRFPGQARPPRGSDGRARAGDRARHQ
jgi:RNA polymerase sigma factor (sigma-70 family)